MRQCQRQGVGHCCLGPTTSPLSAPQAHGETGRERSGDAGWMEGEGKRKAGKRRESEGKAKKGRLKEKDKTAVYCHLWRPAAVRAKEFVSLWWCYPVYFSSMPFLSLSRSLSLTFITVSTLHNTLSLFPPNLRVVLCLSHFFCFHRTLKKRNLNYHTEYCK